MPKNISDKEFKDKVLNSKKPVLVDFWAEWCNPCKQLIPILEEAEGELADKIEIVKVNIDQNPEAPSKYGVRSIPTLILFEDGKPKATTVGLSKVYPKDNLVKWVNSEV